MRRYLFTLVALIVLVPTYGQAFKENAPYALIKSKSLIERQIYDSALIWADEGMSRAALEFGRKTEGFVFFIRNMELAYEAAGQSEKVEPMYEAYYEELKVAPTDSALMNHLRLKSLIETLSKVGFEEMGKTMNIMQGKLGAGIQDAAMSAYSNPDSSSRRWTTVLAMIELGDDFKKIDEQTEENKEIFEDTPLEGTANNVFGSIGLFKKAKKTEEKLDEYNSPEDSVEGPKIGVRALLGMKRKDKKQKEKQKKEEPLQSVFTLSEQDLASMSKEKLDSVEAVVIDEYTKKKHQRDTSQSMFSNVMFATTALSAGVFYEMIGRIQQADTFFANANDGFHNYMENMSLLAGSEDQMSSISDFYSFSNYANSFVLRNYREHPSITGLAYNNILLEKGQLLEKNRIIQRAVTTSEEDYLFRLYDLWIEAKNIMAANQINQTEDGDTREYLDSVNYAMQELKKELNRQTRTDERQQWQAIQTGLSPGEAVVEFLHFPYYGKQNPLKEEEIDEDEPVTLYDSIYYTALVMRAGDEYPLFVPLCKEADFSQLLEGETSGGVAGQLYRGAGAVKSSVSKGDQLYDLIWQPLDPLLKDTEKVSFSPAGLLHQVAFAGLPYGNGYLVDRYQLHHISSTRLLAYQGELPEASIESAALFGGVDYNADLNELLAMAQNDSLVSYGSLFVKGSKQLPKAWNELEATLSEVDAIANLLRDQQIPTNYYTGSSAMEERFKMLGNRYATSPSVIHVATHGFFYQDDTDPEPSEEDEDEDLYDPNEALRRSGLIFAGGNHAWQGKKIPKDIDDGILLAVEAAPMNLQKTDLVVLSACETGLGEIQNSEGVYGLQRAIREAGARYLIMSLWTVPDEPTKEMMQMFYQYYLQDKLPIREAFIKTQQQMRQRYEPYSWAAFTLVE
ncbi:MAG: CHAT domain-containing protein [Bacteroidota bacterium]